MTKTIGNQDYAHFLKEVKYWIQSARISAGRAVNREMILLYWDIGRGIVEKQKELGWGKSVVERLSLDLKAELPGMTGLSPDNLWRMRQFYKEYSAPEFLSQAASELKRLKSAQLLEQAVPELPTPKELKAALESSEETRKK